jgi:hypothetical protein
MGGNASRSQLTVGPFGDGGLGFRLAVASDDSALRRLLRTNPMEGDITLSFEREPSFFNGVGIEGPWYETIVATENGRIVAVGNVSERDRFLNGVPARFGYLGGLRLDASCRGRGSILRRGYEFLRQFCLQGGPRIYLSSIVADNTVARRILERCLPGMPVYRALEPFTTVLLRVHRRSVHDLRSVFRARPVQQGFTLGAGTHEVLGKIVSLLNESNRRYQFAPVWTAEDLLSSDRCPGLQPEDFTLAWIGRKLVGCAALWDQSGFKQTVVNRYRSRIDRWRRVANFLPGLPTLPEPGSVLAHGYVSHLATAAGDDQVLTSLVESLRCRARACGLDYLTLGFASRDPRLVTIQRTFGGRRYVSMLYAVCWPEDREALAVLDGRLPAPEVAVL